MTAHKLEAVFADVLVPTAAKVTGWGTHPDDGPIRFLTCWVGHGEQSSVSVEGEQYLDGRVDRYVDVHSDAIDGQECGVRLSLAATLELATLLTEAASKLVTR
jgi:hypothetical protein